MKPSYGWPFGLSGFCWRDDRLFYLYVNGLGFIFLLTPTKPVLVRALDVSDPNRQQVIDIKSLPRGMRRDINRTARQAHTLAATTNSLVGRLRLAQIPESFPNILPLLTGRRWNRQMYFGLQSDFDH